MLPVAALGEIEFRPACAEETDCALTYRAITDSGLGAVETLKLQLVSKKDTTPVCTDVQMETYKNIANTGALAASDEDGDALTYQIVRAPKRAASNSRTTAASPTRLRTTRSAATASSTRRPTRRATSPTRRA